MTVKELKDKLHDYAEDTINFHVEDATIDENQADNIGECIWKEVEEDITERYAKDGDEEEDLETLTEEVFEEEKDKILGRIQELINDAF